MSIKLLFTWVAALSAGISITAEPSFRPSRDSTTATSKGFRVRSPRHSGSIFNAPPKATFFPIRYKTGGKVLVNAVNIYNIFYGNWSESDMEIVDHFVSNLGKSDWYTTNMQYYYQANSRSDKEYVKNEINLVKSVADNYSLGPDLKSGFSVVEYHIVNKNLPLDPDGIYYVLASSDVFLKGLCNQWCGWHDYQRLNRVNVYHGFIGVPEFPSCKGCSANDGVISPNKSPGVDALIDTFAHEIVEAISDPELNAWLDIRGWENADKCNWHYGNMSSDEFGAKYNVFIGSRPYLIQQNWSPETQTCVGGF